MGCGSARCAPAVRLQSEPGAGVHHWYTSGVDGRDDLFGIDSLKVGAGGRQMRVAELALDQRQRDPFMQQFNGVCVT
jgi:hypothetical protein